MQFRASDKLARLFQEHRQNPEGLVLHLNPAAILEQFSGLEVDYEAAEADHPETRLWLHERPLFGGCTEERFVRGTSLLIAKSILPLTKMHWKGSASQSLAFNSRPMYLKETSVDDPQAANHQLPACGPSAFALISQ
jgi:hypothetical protein